MAVSLKHTFQSAKADGADASLIQPSNWNDEHTLTLGTNALLGRTTAGPGAAEEITVGTGLSLAAGSLTNSAPDQTVSLTQGGTTTIAGTYPSFTISSADQYTGTVTDVAALTLGTSGTDLSSMVATGTTTPVITLNVPTASAANRGALSSTDWSTFNGKQAALVSGTNIKTVNGNTLLGSGDVTISSVTNWTEAVNTSAPNATVPVVSFTATNGATNVDAAIRPKGTGALTAQIADSTATGGNKRGANAVDWQTLRAAAAQVASNTASVVSGGQNNTASSSSATVSGGDGNTASATQATVGGGATNTASSTSATVSGGDTNTASGQRSTIAGGAYGTTRSLTGNWSHAACNIPIAATAGASQLSRLIIARATTDATPTVLASNSSAAATTNQVILPNNSAYYFKGKVIAAKTAAGDTSAWTFEGAIKRGANAASTALVAAVTPALVAQDAGASTWTVAVAADTTNGGLKVTVTGQAATTIRWVCHIETTEVTY